MLTGASISQSPNRRSTLSIYLVGVKESGFFEVIFINSEEAPKLESATFNAQVLVSLKRENDQTSVK